MVFFYLRDESLGTCEKMNRHNGNVLLTELVPLNAHRAMRAVKSHWYLMPHQKDIHILIHH